MDNPFVGRIVVLLTPLLAALTVVIVNAVQDWTGVALDGTQLSVLLTGAVVAVVGVVYKWLDNRGKYEEILQSVEATGGPGFKDPVPPAEVE
jgi:hypothetical protein